MKFDLVVKPEDIDLIDKGDKKFYRNIYRVNFKTESDYNYYYSLLNLRSSIDYVNYISDMYITFKIRVPDNVALDIVTHRPYLFWIIKRPSEEVQITGVSFNGYAIQYIQEPSEKVQLAAINQNPHAINFIRNPTDKVQYDAVEKNPSVIAHIRKPTLEVQLLAISRDTNLMDYIYQPNKETVELYQQIRNERL